MVASITRFLDPRAALAAAATDSMEFTESRPLGGTWVLDALWTRLGIGDGLVDTADDACYRRWTGCSSACG